MTTEEKRNFIRKKTEEHIPESNEKISWSLHAIKKLRLEGVRKIEIENALKDCIIIEDYAMEGRLFPGCLALIFVDSKPIHAVIAIDNDFDRIFIITVYKPLAERWGNDWKTRKR